MRKANVIVTIFVTAFLAPVAGALVMLYARARPDDITGTLFVGWMLLGLLGALAAIIASIALEEN